MRVKINNERRMAMHKLNKWINKADDIEISGNEVKFKVLTKTDFWQISHYGFSRTDGNCYVADIEEDICFTAKIKMNYISEFDQCGLIIYHDEENFAKVCVENQLGRSNKLGSVVCKSKRSDWASQPFGDEASIYFRVSKRGINFLLETSADGNAFEQMRLFDLPGCEKVSIGVFGASPLGEGFTAEFSEMSFSENKWYLDSNDIPDHLK